ncbi:MAG: (p)ppGpp synthetase SpoT/RelA [Parcubacteria group bacterium]|nr:(p)ppGpp synthetase SpoT/RelA [Parcubacteria group bacterium]
MQQHVATESSSTTLENRESFFNRIRSIWPEESPQYRLVLLSYDTAKDALRGIEREEGVRYFEHARSVALILIDRLRVDDSVAISLALLHDVIEENSTQWSLARVQDLFGAGIAEDIRLLTKPSEMMKLTDSGMSYHASFWYAPRRVATVKLADRYHNLTTLRFCSLAKQLRKRDETREHYLPLARYWGILDKEIEQILNEPPELRLEGVP